MSKIGVHVVIGPRNGYGDFVRRCAEAGQPVPLVKCVDDFGAAFEAKGISAQTLTMGRLNALGGRDLQAWEPRDFPNAAAAASEYYDLLRPKWEQNPSIDVWETFNEFSAHWGWQADFFIALMDRVEPDGFRLGLYAASTGNPPESAYPDIARACRRAKAHGGHVLTLHEYGGVGTDVATLRGTQPFHALRYRRLYETLRAENADCPLVITECGQNGGAEFIGVDAFIEDLAWYDGELMNDGYVRGAAAWTLGNWANANFQEALPALAEYIITHPTAPPPEPRRYDRNFALYHSSQYFPDWVAPAVERAWTAGLSADDAGLSGPNVNRRRVIAVNDALWGNDPTLEDWLDRNYPGIEYVGVDADSPDALRAAFEAIDQPPPPPPPPPPPLPPGNAWRGLHMRADGPNGAGDFECIPVARLNAVKILTSTPSIDFDMLVTLGVQAERIVLRLFADFRNRIIGPDEFYGWMTGPLRWFADRGGRYVEVHNEPNHPLEGLGQSWQNGAEFAQWYTVVMGLIRRDFPILQIGFPGLSPAPNVSEWLDACAGVIGQSDWVGAHAYWQMENQIDADEHGGYWKRFLRFGKPVLITEFANVSNAPKADKGRQYARYYALLPQQVLGAFSFVSSASDLNFAPQTWVDELGNLTDIPRMVGQEITTLFPQDLTRADITTSGQDRTDLVMPTGVPAERIRKRVNLADLMRIKGIGEEYANLLVEVGVGSVKELRSRRPANLHKDLIDTNAAKRLVRRSPSLGEVQRWVREAKRLKSTATR